MSSDKRLASVDALRGLAVAGMLLVNDPGDWGHIYAPLEHSAWNGFTPTDLVFPLFLFIVGVSLALALGPKLDRGSEPRALAPAVWQRGARIVALGLVLNLLAWWLMSKPELRIPGVLQRIGLCFAVVGSLAVYLRARAQWIVLVALLAGYALLLGMSSLGKIGSIEQLVDTWMLGRHNYEWDPATGIGFDPEGIVSTLGGLATCLLGLRCGDWLRRGRVKALLMLGLGSAALGLAWSCAQLPMNKQLWTPSFVLWAGGLSTLLLVLAHVLVDRKGWPPVGRAFGVNAITAYAGAWMTEVLLEGFGWMQPLYVNAFSWVDRLAGPTNASLAYAIAFVAVWAVIVKLLDQRGWYWKI